MAKLRKNPPMSSFLAGPSQSVYPQISRGSNMGPWYHPSTCSNLNPDIHSNSFAVSRTMSYARVQAGSAAKMVSSSCSDMDTLTRRPATAVNRATYLDDWNSPYSSYDTAPAPRTEAERYWAYRAIVAETKLAEHRGLRTDELERMKEKLGRQFENDSAHKYHAEHALRLERLAIGLISTIVLITLILLFRYPVRSEDKFTKRAFRPHLTIPILSPFTSIVEHEDSGLSFRTTAAFVIILGVLLYAMFRYWMNRRPR